MTKKFNPIPYIVIGIVLIAWLVWVWVGALSAHAATVPGYAQGVSTRIQTDQGFYIIDQGYFRISPYVDSVSGAAGYSVEPVYYNTLGFSNYYSDDPYDTTWGAADYRIIYVSEVSVLYGNIDFLPNAAIDPGRFSFANYLFVDDSVFFPSCPYVQLSETHAYFNFGGSFFCVASPILFFDGNRLLLNESCRLYELVGLNWVGLDYDDYGTYIGTDSVFRIIGDYGFFDDFGINFLNYFLDKDDVALDVSVNIIAALGEFFVGMFDDALYDAYEAGQIIVELYQEYLQWKTDFRPTQGFLSFMPMKFGDFVPTSTPSPIPTAAPTATAAPTPSGNVDDVFLEFIQNDDLITTIRSFYLYDLNYNKHLDFDLVMCFMFAQRFDDYYDIEFRFFDTPPAGGSGESRNELTYIFNGSYYGLKRLDKYFESDDYRRYHFTLDLNGANYQDFGYSRVTFYRFYDFYVVNSVSDMENQYYAFNAYIPFSQPFGLYYARHNGLFRYLGNWVDIDAFEPSTAPEPTLAPGDPTPTDFPVNIPTFIPISGVPDFGLDDVLGDADLEDNAAAIDLLGYAYSFVPEPVRVMITAFLVGVLAFVIFRILLW